MPSTSQTAFRYWPIFDSSTPFAGFSRLSRVPSVSNEYPASRPGGLFASLGVRWYGVHRHGPPPRANRNVSSSVRLGHGFVYTDGQGGSGNLSTSSRVSSITSRSLSNDGVTAVILRTPRLFWVLLSAHSR